MNFMTRLRNSTSSESIDYVYLMDKLKEYRSPRAKVTTLLKSNSLIRVKKGLYIFGPQYRRSIYSLEDLANKIYGPSYVSMEYALSYYGFIPEHVVEITSSTTKRNRLYETPVGRFRYFHMPLSLYSKALVFTDIGDGNTALLATPEKALNDLFYIRRYKVGSTQELESLLFDDLRLDERMVVRLRLTILSSILKAGGSPVIEQLLDWIRRNR